MTVNGTKVLFGTATPRREIGHDLVGGQLAA